MSFTKQFAQYPQAFGNQYTLMPSCDKPLNQAHLKSLALSDHTELHQVQGDNKVAFCDILSANTVDVGGDMGGNYRGVGNLMVMKITADRPNPDALPVYYLPWNIDQMFRIKLKPSPHHAQKTPTWFYGAFGGETIVPNVFITAAVQGCSVFVEGDPTCPVVYHVNAASASQPGGTLDTNDQMLFLATAQHKRQHMTTRMQTAQREFPKTNSPHAVGAAHLMDYMPDRAPDDIAALTARYAHELATDNLEVSQFGTIFGMRENDAWVFYRQTRTLVDYRLATGWITEFRNPVCQRFWP
jgi:hypothetical protein